MTQVKTFIHWVEYLHSRSALSSCPDYTLPQPAHPGAVLFSLSPDDGHNDAPNMLS